MKNKIGFIISIIGILHCIIALIKFSNTFLEMCSEGLFNTGQGAQKGWFIWFTFTGFLFIFLGTIITYIEKKDLKIPTTLGYFFLSSSIIGVIILPLSGFWALFIPSILIIKSNK